MSLNIPKDPLSVDGNAHLLTGKTTKDELSSEAHVAASSQDSMKSAKKEDVQTRLTPRLNTAPELIAPRMALGESYRIFLAAIQNFNEVLSASDQADLATRSRFSQIAFQQSREFSNLIAQRQEALTVVEKDVNQEIQELERKLREMKEISNEQQRITNEFKLGEAEQKPFDDLVRAHDFYIGKLKSIGAVDKGNGNWEVPNQSEDVLKKYNEFTQNYQAAVLKFDEFRKDFATRLDKYQIATIQYNQKVVEYNHFVDDFSRRNSLPAEFKDSIPLMTPLNLVDFLGNNYPIQMPQTIQEVPALIYFDSLPDNIRSIAAQGLPSLPQLPRFPEFNPASIASQINKNFYEKSIADFDQAMLLYTNYWPFIWRRAIEEIDKRLTNDETLLNSKELVQELFSNANKRIKESSESSEAMLAMDLQDDHLQAILGRSLMNEVLKNCTIKLDVDEKGVKDKIIDQFVDQMLIMSIGLLGTQGILSLFPSLSLISNVLGSLPKDSPAFAILFAVSLSNRIQEDINQGMTTQALEEFFNETPELSELEPQDREKLIASFNLGLTLVAGKLIEESLGLQGLMANLMPLMTSNADALPLDVPAIVSQSNTEKQEENTVLLGNVKEHFIQEKFSEDQAQFLANFAVEWAEQGILTPNSPAIFSEKNVNRVLLENSISSALILSQQLTPQEAGSLAKEVVDFTLTESPFPSSKQFRSALETNLSHRHVRNSHDIVKQAVFIPNQEKSLDRTGNPAQFSSPTTLRSLVEKRTLQLLTPQLGAKLAMQIGQEIGKSLLGSPSLEGHSPQSPYALVNVIAHQLEKLQRKDNQNWASAVHDTFKESIKTMESFYEFSLKIMDPAYLYVFASGVIYGNQGIKKAIDIQI